MDRRISAHLADWLKSRHRKPLILRGARQVGKTWLVRNLATHSGRRLVELNFEREVKSGASGSMKSLHQFVFDKKLELAVRFDRNPPSIAQLSVTTTQGNAVSYRLVSLPPYLVSQLNEILSQN